MERNCARMLWQLYADAATRMNLLIDECAHLQHTIQGHLGNQDVSIFGIASPQPGDEYRPRSWLPGLQTIRANQYYEKAPQERALCNLFYAVGALGYALEENSKTLKGAFERVTDQFGKDALINDSIYWFLSLRGHFLGRVFNYYLEHIEHAQKKLIQLLENTPSTLPSPTLMRRWSSGGYGDFLSNYSRQVNRSVQQLAWDFCKPSGENFDDWRANQLMVHTWSHNSTSITTRNTVWQRESSPEQVSVTTVWSSYFYLEQPILFPLLYHECSHHYETKKALGILEDEEVSSATQRMRSLWLERSDELAALFKRLLPMEGNDRSFWGQYAGELCSDLISLALCGDGFLAALTLQIVGLSTHDPAYSDYDPSTDTRVNLDRIGARDLRTYEIQTPSESLGYFWVSRLKFSLRAYCELYPGRQDGWCKGIESLLRAWSDSGASAMARDRVSSEHDTFWSYRTKLNDWATNAAWECFADLVEKLKPAVDAQRAGNEFTLHRELLDLLEQDVSAYGRHVFEPFLKDPGKYKKEMFSVRFDAKRAWRLEDLCAHIRWEFSDEIVQQIISSHERFDEPGRERWLAVYLNNMACDGSVSFRLAQEWLAIRDDLATTAGVVSQEKLENKQPSRKFTNAESAFMDKLVGACSDDIRGLSVEDARLKVATLVKAKYFALKDFPHLRQLIDEFLVGDTLRELRGVLDSKDTIGSFTLGVLKPAFVASRPSYKEAFEATAKYYKQIEQRRQAEIEKVSLKAKDCKSYFMPLFGEYNYAVFQPGLASSNRTYRLFSHPPTIQKPRAVVKLTTALPSVSCSVAFTRVSQVSFRYRWQWVLLAQGLSEQADIYLSSGWEDLIVVTYYSNTNEFDYESSKHGLYQRHWLDMHSSIGLPQIPDWNVSICSIAGQATTFESRWAEYGCGTGSERTGRYDVSFAWKASDPVSLWTAMCSIPTEEWRGIGAFSTAMVSEGVRGKPRRHSFVSQMMLQDVSL